jgi:hypothetical protein|uniref:Uncharacterized protein n=1 Tax=Bionectria ochroleuca TaxID=29856 RepID=A0A8H7K4C2_BIOOC
MAYPEYEQLVAGDLYRQYVTRKTQHAGMSDEDSPDGIDGHEHQRNSNRPID